MNPPVVLLGGLNLLRPLGFAGIPAIVASDEPDAPAFASRYCEGRCLLPPPDRPGALLESLLRLGDEMRERFEERPPLFYGNDQYLSVVQEHRDSLARRYRFLLNDLGLDRALLDKRLFEQLAARRGIAVPRTLSWDALGEFDAPVLAKPVTRIARLANPAFRTFLAPDEKARVFAKGAAAATEPLVEQLHRELAFQEYVPGSDRDLRSFHGYADESCRLLAWFCGRKIRTYPALTGMSSFVELTHDAQLEAVGRSVAERLGLKGVFKIDFKRDARNGRLLVLEVNARFNMWHHVAARNGVNLPQVAYEYLVRGARPLRNAYGRRFRWLYFRLDCRAYRELAASRKLTLWQWIASLLAGPKVYDLFSWSDPLPFLLHLRGRLQRVGRRLAGFFSRPIAVR
jgi:predicted ATP-grasp superfamily ATP-dependent carboligase